MLPNLPNSQTFSEKPETQIQKHQRDSEMGFENPKRLQECFFWEKVDLLTKIHICSFFLQPKKRLNKRSKSPTKKNRHVLLFLDLLKILPNGGEKWWWIPWYKINQNKHHLKQIQDLQKTKAFLRSLQTNLFGAKGTMGPGAVHKPGESTYSFRICAWLKGQIHLGFLNLNQGYLLNSYGSGVMTIPLLYRNNPGQLIIWILTLK